MSWTVDGRTYHDYSEYLAAQERQSAREAEEQARSARAAADRHQRRVREQEAELTKTRDDLARQRRVNEQMHQEARSLEREQQQLAQAQARFERESNVRLGEIRAHLQGTDARLAAAEEEHRKHIEATQRAFSQAREALKAGLEEAERRRQAAEQQLNAAIAKVNAKVEADRQDRLRRQTSDLDQARMQIAMVEEVLGQLAGGLKAVNLEEDEKGIRFILQSAQMYLQQGKAETALASAESAFNEARALIYKSEKRRAELAAVATAIADRLEALRDIVKAEPLDKYFKGEKVALVNNLDRIAARLPRRYQQYNRMEDDLREDERVIGKLEEEARAMVAMCANLADQYVERRQRVTQLARKIGETYGGGADVRAQLTDPQDLKSPLIVNCVFDGGAKVRIEAGIDGELKIDGVGHQTQANCDRRAAEVVQMLRSEMSVTNQRTLAGNPNALPERAQAGKGVAWRDVSTRLADIGREI